MTAFKHVFFLTTEALKNKERDKVTCLSQHERDRATIKKATL